MSFFTLYKMTGHVVDIDIYQELVGLRTGPCGMPDGTGMSAERAPQ